MRGSIEGVRLPGTAVAAYAIAALVAILLPLWIASHPSGLVATTRGPGFAAYELFGLTASMLILGFGAHAATKVRGLARRDALVRLLPVLLPGLIGLQYLPLVTEFSDRSWDWGCYERAAHAVLAGTALYEDCYLYPPLFAESLALAQRALAGLLPWLGARSAAAPAVTLYVYQCSQLFALQACVYLTLRFALRCGLRPAVAAAVVGALFVFGNPVVRTIHNEQVNLFVMALVLLAIERLGSRPLLAGGSLALAAHLKLTPVVLLAAWLADRRWRAVAATLAVGVAVVGIEVAVQGGGPRWTGFVAAVAANDALPEDAPLGPPPLFRNGSLWAVSENTARLFVGSLGASPGLVRDAARALGVAATLACAFGFAVRARRRRRESRGESPLLGDTVDALAFPLLCAPLVWEHHYVMAMPLAILAVARRGRELPLWIAAAGLLVFALPTFDVYPLSYHRLVGLAMLLWATRPMPREPVASE